MDMAGRTVAYEENYICIGVKKSKYKSKKIVLWGSAELACVKLVPAAIQCTEY